MLQQIRSDLRNLSPTRRQIVATGAGVHCVVCGVTKVRIGSNETQLPHPSGARENCPLWLEATRSILT